MGKGAIGLPHFIRVCHIVGTSELIKWRRKQPVQRIFNGERPVGYVIDSRTCSDAKKNSVNCTKLRPLNMKNATLHFYHT